MAKYRVVATVKNGRIVFLVATSLPSGVERKAARAMVAAIETALSDDYVCPGDNVFVEEFIFKVD